MGLWDFLKETQPPAPIHVPLTPEEARTVTGFGHKREWFCGCGARLAIRSREAHPDEPSNCRLKRDGHADQQPHALTWNGLAHERGWQTDPVTCPACQLQLSRARYKELKRSHSL